MSLVNGLVKYSKSAEIGRYLVNTVAAFSCNSGYQLNGTNSATCQASGNWNEQTPTCEGYYGFFSNK